MSSPPSISTILRDQAVEELAVVAGHDQRALEVAQEAPRATGSTRGRDGWSARRAAATSGRSSRMRASATRIFQPPESLPTSPSMTSWREAEAGQDLARASLEAVAVELLEARPAPRRSASTSASSSSRPVRVGQRLFEVAAAPCGDRSDRPGAVHRLGDHAAPGHLADVLAEVADGDVRDRRAPGPRRAVSLAHDQAKDRGLAGAVGPDQADLLAAKHARRGLDEEDLLAVLLRDVVESDHAGRRLTEHGRGSAAARTCGPARRRGRACACSCNSQPLKTCSRLL